MYVSNDFFSLIQKKKSLSLEFNKSGWEKVNFKF